MINKVSKQAQKTNYKHPTGINYGQTYVNRNIFYINSTKLK